MTLHPDEACVWAPAPEDGVGHVMGSEGAHPVRETAVSKDPLSIERIGRIGMSRPYKPPMSFGAVEYD